MQIVRAQHYVILIPVNVRLALALVVQMLTV
jgi:hypothetical protein